MARDEDIFKKLNKQKPIVKQKELQPLSSGDFTLSRNTINVPVGSPDKRRIVKVKNERNEPAIFSRESERAVEIRREPARKASSGLINGREKRSYDESPRISRKETESYKTRGEERSSKHLRREEPDLIFSETARPQKTYEPHSAARARSAPVFRPAADAEGKFPLRHELKYYINYCDYVLLRSSLKSLISADPNADSNNSYHVRSLYFDDIHNSALAEKIAGSDYRKKYRVRIYNFRDDNIKFEKKYKIGQYVGKDSISLTRGEYDSIIAGDCDFLLNRDEELAKEIYLQIKGSLLRPKVIVDYVREAYVSPFEDCRITFDKDLKASIMLKDIFDPDTPMMPMYESGIMVLEVKFDRFLPVTVKRVLNTITVSDRRAISKYVISRRFD